MYPVVFEIFGFEARSYYLLWAFALLLFLRFTYRRCIMRYNAEPEIALSALLAVYCAGIAGAIAGGAVEKLPLICSGRADITLLLKGGASSGFGILCGGFAGIYRLRGEKFTPAAFADASSVPLAAMLCIGRIGCLLEGCCRGAVIDKCAYALHFPNESYMLYRFPSQLLESAAAAVICFVLLAAERKIVQKRGEGLLFSLFLILYGLYRLFFDRFREISPDAAFSCAGILSVVAVICGLYRIYICKYRCVK